MLTRRNLIKATSVVGIAAVSPAHIANAQTPQTATNAKLGDPKQAFDDMFGESHEEGDYAVYDFSADGKASYWVKFDANGLAERIEIDFEALPNNGLEIDVDAEELQIVDESMGMSQFLRDDAATQFSTQFSNSAPTPYPEFHLAQHYSETLAADSGRSGNVLVVDTLLGLDPAGPGPYIVVANTSVAMEAFEINEIVPTGNKPGILNDASEWEEEYGEYLSTSTLPALSTPPVPGLWLFTDEVLIEPDEPFTPQEAATWIGDMLPADAELLTTYWLPETPPSPSGLRIHVWQHSDSGYIISMQFVENGEEGGVVTKLIIDVAE